MMDDMTEPEEIIEPTPSKDNNDLLALHDVLVDEMLWDERTAPGLRIAVNKIAEQFPQYPGLARPEPVTDPALLARQTLIDGGQSEDAADKTIAVLQANGFKFSA
jgi:hypothetical protein